VGKTQWIELAGQFGIELTRVQADQFESYFRELVAWNARTNLTTIVAYEDVTLKHFLDSLSLAPIVRDAKSLIDIGSGAGFPGLPLKIARPDLRVTLLEATGKKVKFINHVIATLGLVDAAAIHARAEELGRDPGHRERYDAAVARAVAELPTLAEYALPFVRVGGIFVAQKGAQVEEEIERAGGALDRLGGRVREAVPVKLPGLEQRHLIVIEKIASTPAQYPRRSGMPEKRRL
jgi:16S rRNA (guanine527-N7)-methyltransferase